MIMEKTVPNTVCARVCRLCLSSRGEILPIFESGSSLESDSTLLASKIQACVSVEITEGDLLPTYVCRKCLNNVNNWHSFKKVCVESQAKLQDWLKNDFNDFEKVENIKKEPFLDDINDNEENGAINDSYAENRKETFNNATNRIQPEGPPILASLGLAPRSEKENLDSEEEEEEEDKEIHNDQPRISTSTPGQNSLPSNYTSTLQVSQLASKDCLVCGRSYRYSHNARRHELTSHNYDRYTNKMKGSAPKLRPNPFNPKARLLSNPHNPQAQLFSKISNNAAVTVRKVKSHSYPIRIKALSDLQIKSVKRPPEILKTLLSAQRETIVTEQEPMRSGSESPETLISEPEISSYQVEAIITEPESIDNQISHTDDEVSHIDEENSQHPQSEMVDIDTDNELEIAKEIDINKIIGIDQNGQIDTPEEENSEQIKPDYNEESQEIQDTDQGNEIEIDEPPIQEDEEGKEEDEVYNNDDGQFQDEDDDLPLVPIAPIVEINEEPNTNTFPSEINDDESKTNDEEDQYLRINEEKTSSAQTYITKAQKIFISKYRDIIEQINTKECHCCQRVHPRRKAVIQHLQKNGFKIPKHTCYNCVVTFGHIGALLSHMRANVCTDMWKVIYKEGGITDDMLMEDGAPQEEGSKFDSNVNETINKGQYKDILNARSYACRLCPAKFQLKLFVMKHVLDVHENGLSKIPLLCQHCGYRFKENRLWKKHTRNGECTVNIACDLCPERFHNMLDFNEHAMTVHAGGFVDQSNENTTKAMDGRPTDCTICDKNMSSYHNLVKHLKNVHNEEKPHMCRHCDSKFELVSDLNHHIYLEHNEHATGQSELNIKHEIEEFHYTCTDCKIAFDSVDGLTDHQISIHGQEAHECDQCDRKFLQASDLSEHKNTHLKVKFYTCTVCPNSYSSVDRLNDHMELSHPDASRNAEQFYCDVCVRSFKSRQAFSNHMRIHAKVPTHNRRSGELRPASSHSNRIIKPNPVYQESVYIPYQKQMATGDAPYSCDICGKGFIHKKNIWKHKKVLHPEVVSQMKSPDRYISLNYPQTDNPTEEEDYGNDDNSTGLSIPQFDSFTSAGYEPYDNGRSETETFKCDLCGKKFSAKTSVWKHKRLKHGIVAAPKEESNSSESNRTSCTICKITFSDKKSYYRHRKNVHKASTQMCKICGKHLNSALELYEHLKAAHARELLGYNASQGGSKQNDTNNVQEYSDEDGNEKRVSQTDSFQARYPCDVCGQHFLGMLALQNHQCKKQSGQNDTFDCEICHKSYTSISALKSHRGWHLRSPDGKAAANSAGLWMPHNKVTNKVSKHEVIEPLPRRQSIPSSAVSFVPQLKRKLPPEVEVTIVNTDKKKRMDDEAGGLHLMARSSVSSEDRYCNICDKEFTKRAAYQRHMEEVHQPNSVFCPVCDKSFTRKSTLLVHMRKHYDTSGEYEGDPAEGLGAVDAMVDYAPNSPNSTVYPCDICGVHYRSSKSLRRHRIRRHADIFGTGGPSSGSMSVLMDDDSEEEEEEDEEGSQAMPVQGPGEFTCTQCGDGVASPRDLIIHRQMHNTPSKFHCNVCRVYFARAIDLSAHTRARHADNDKVFFPCAMCDRFYMNKKSLQRHIENAH